MTNGGVIKSSPTTKKTKVKGIVKQEKNGDADEEEDIFHGLDFGDGSADVSMDGDELTF